MKTKIADLIENHAPLKFDSLVVDCGGYKGEYSQEIIRRWNPYVIIFEPVREFYDFCVRKFNGFVKVVIYPYALGLEGGTQNLYLNGRSSSFYKEWAGSEDTIRVPVVKLSNFIKDKTVDILKINCEGAEFEILEDLDTSNMLKDIDEILVQFHKIPDFKSKYLSAIALLNQTHERVLDFKWELWKKKQI